MPAPGTLAVIIPAYNEAESIADVVEDVRRHAPQAEIVVVDDGSSDDTAAAARRARATIISLPYNLGVSAAMQTGYRYAAPLHDYVVRVDGDGQHDAAGIASLLQPVQAGQADFVVGSRFAAGRPRCGTRGSEGAGPPPRRSCPAPSGIGGLGGPHYRPSVSRAIGIRFFSALVRLVSGLRLSDTTSGFHACTRQAASFLAANMPGDYPEIEGLILLQRAGFRIEERPVTMRPRRRGASSIGPLRAVYFVLKVTVAVGIGLLRARPRRERSAV